MKKLVELNHIYSKWTGKREEIASVLSYEKELWIQGPFHKEKQMRIYDAVLRNNCFYSGFFPRVKKHLEDSGVVFESESIPFDVPEVKQLKGITYNDFQRQMLAQLVKAGRGVWTAPTGSGKTIPLAGLNKIYSGPILTIVHSKDLLAQTVEEYNRFFDKRRVAAYGAGEREIKQHTVAIINSAYKSKEILDHNWTAVLIDEVQHLSSFKGMVAKLLRSIKVGHRFGVTATLPADEEKCMVIEGLVGPTVGKTTYNEVSHLLAKPKIKLVFDKSGDSFKWKKAGQKSYVKVYTEAIVKNRKRNALIIQEAKKLIDQGLSVLIIVERLRHGAKLIRMAELEMPGTFVFLHGETKDEIRKEEKKYFQKQERKGVIATRIWGEGTNVKSIGAVINAVGGESEIATIQRFGRGMRKDEGKETVILVDIIDANSHDWFMKHSMKRICFYSDMNWI